MKNQMLSLINSPAQTFSNYLKRPKKVDNLFVVTHLGQLKQMEALIKKKQFTNNGLVVLYAITNFVVPQTVHDKFDSSLFDFVVFVEIPAKVNQVNYRKLSTIQSLYETLVNKSKPKNLFLNSFEGHYAILISIAKQNHSKIILVEEGTATYKLLSSKDNDENNIDDVSIDYQFIKNKFMKTVGQAELFKRLVKHKKYTVELFVKSQQFYRDLIADEKIQEKLIKVLARDSIKAYKKPFLQFDEVYASFPDLIEKSFNAPKVESFNIYEKIDDVTLESAQEVVLAYGMTNQDVLYLSQRYGIDPNQYVNTVIPILLDIAKNNRKVFIKLHPKESDKTLKAFQEIVKAFPNKFVLIEDNRFLVEPVIKVSQVQKVVGLTSTALVYAPLISENTQAISVAKSLVNLLPKTEQNKTGGKVILEHLEILKIFNNIHFYGEQAL